MNHKTCRNCQTINTPRKRKCAECGGNRFDKLTDEQQAERNTEKENHQSHIEALVAKHNL